MSEPDWRTMADPLNDRLPPRRSGNVADAHDQVIQARLGQQRCVCGHHERVHAGGNCLAGTPLDACACYGFIGDDFVFPSTCNCTKEGLPYCGRPECDIDWCWYCGDEYTEPCPRHEGVDHV